MRKGWRVGEALEVGVGEQNKELCVQRGGNGMAMGRVSKTEGLHVKVLKQRSVGVE